MGLRIYRQQWDAEIRGESPQFQLSQLLLTIGQSKSQCSANNTHSQNHTPKRVARAAADSFQGVQNSPGSQFAQRVGANWAICAGGHRNGLLFWNSGCIKVTTFKTRTRMGIFTLNHAQPWHFVDTDTTHIPMERNVQAATVEQNGTRARTIAALAPTWRNERPRLAILETTC